MNPWPSPIRSRHLPSLASAKMPRSLWGLVWHLSATDQIWAAFLSIAVALLDTAPIEVQRRIVNGITGGHDFQPVLILTLIYGALVLVQGLTKLLLNVYRSWIAENSVGRFGHSSGASRAAALRRTKRMTCVRKARRSQLCSPETDPVGTFVGASVSEPLLQIGILCSVFGYLRLSRVPHALVAVAGSRAAIRIRAAHPAGNQPQSLQTHRDLALRKRRHGGRALRLACGATSSRDAVLACIPPQHGCLQA